MKKKSINEEELERQLNELEEGGGVKGIIIPKGWLEHLRIMCNLKSKR